MARHPIEPVTLGNMREVGSALIILDRCCGAVSDFFYETVSG
jgi:hypothetical protein